MNKSRQKVDPTERIYKMSGNRQEETTSVQRAFFECSGHISVALLQVIHWINVNDIEENNDILSIDVDMKNDSASVYFRPNPNKQQTEILYFPKVKAEN